MAGYSEKLLEDGTLEFESSREVLTVVSNTARVREALHSSNYGNHFVAFTDGSCAPRDSTSPYGPGGWGALIFGPRGERWELHGSIEDTTSNRAEVCGMLAVLACVSEGVHLGVHSDSRYVVDHVRAGCRANDNHDLWAEVRELVVAKGIKLSASWVQGHNGHRHNERVNTLAISRMRRVAPRSPLAGVR